MDKNLLNATIENDQCRRRVKLYQYSSKLLHGLTVIHSFSSYLKTLVFLAHIAPLYQPEVELHRLLVVLAM